MPDNRNATERVTEALFGAITQIVDNAQQNGDEEALSKVGPVLLTTGAMFLVQGIGMEATARVIKELAGRVERGDFSNPGDHYSGTPQ